MVKYLLIVSISNAPKKKEDRPRNIGQSLMLKYKACNVKLFFRNNFSCRRCCHTYGAVRKVKCEQTAMGLASNYGLGHPHYRDLRAQQPVSPVTSLKWPPFLSHHTDSLK